MLNDYVQDIYRTSTVGQARLKNAVSEVNNTVNILKQVSSSSYCCLLPGRKGEDIDPDHNMSNIRPWFLVDLHARYRCRDFADVGKEV